MPAGESRNATEAAPSFILPRLCGRKEVGVHSIRDLREQRKFSGTVVQGTVGAHLCVRPHGGGSEAGHFELEHTQKVGTVAWRYNFIKLVIVIEIEGQKILFAQERSEFPVEHGGGG